MGRIFLFSIQFGDFGPDMVVQTVMIVLLRILRVSNPDYLVRLHRAIDVAEAQIKHETLPTT